MWNRNAAELGLLVAAVSFAGACSDITTPAPLAFDDGVGFFGGTPDPSTFSASLDADFVRIAEAHPGFGGYFFGEDGTLNIYMAGVAPLSRGLHRSLAAMGVDLAAQPVRVLSGEYDFAQLYAWHAQAGHVLGLEGVVYTDANEAINRVEVGVENAAAAAAVERALAMAGVPREAVNIRETEPVRLMQTLRDRVRPVAGGLQISFPGFLCTLGFNVRSPQFPDVHGFVKASHCTNEPWVTGNTPYWQPSGSIPGPDDPNFIGREAHDVPGFTAPTPCHNVSCPTGRICRNSDAAGGRYAPGVANAFARIYRPLPGTVVIDPVNPMFHIVAASPGNEPVGTEIHKVGRTTGWTSGIVTATCVNTNLAGTNFTLCCQEFVTAPPNSVGVGDSGAPTFRRLGTGADPNIELAGLLWGSAGSTTWMYSSMHRIRMDNPPPPGVEEWRVFPPPPAP